MGQFKLYIKSRSLLELMADNDQAGAQWQKQLVKEALAELLNEIPALKALTESGGTQQGPSQASLSLSAGPSHVGGLEETTEGFVDDTSGEYLV